MVPEHPKRSLTLALGSGERLTAGLTGGISWPLEHARNIAEEVFDWKNPHKDSSPAEGHIV